MTEVSGREKLVPSAWVFVAAALHSLQRGWTLAAGPHGLVRLA